MPVVGDTLTATWRVQRQYHQRIRRATKSPLQELLMSRLAPLVPPPVTVSMDLIATWNVGSNWVTVGDTLTANWKVRQLAGDTLDSQWNTHENLFDLRQLRTPFDEPIAPLVGTQRWILRVRKYNPDALTDKLTMRVELWESGENTADRLIIPDTIVTDETGVVISGTWTATGLSDPTGNSVEAMIVTSVPQGSTVRLQIASFEWQTSYLQNVVVIPTGYADTEAFGNLTVNVNITPVSVSPTGFVDTEAFGNPSISVGTARINVSPTGFSDTEAFGVPSALVRVTETGFSDTEAFGVLTTAPTQSVLPASFSEIEVFGNPNLSVAVNQFGFGDVEDFGVPAAPIQPFPTGFADTEAFGNPLVSAGALYPDIVGSVQWYQSIQNIAIWYLQYPTGIQAGDLLIGSLGVRSSKLSWSTLPSGWTWFFQSGSSAGSTEGLLVTGWRIADGTESGTILFSGSGTGNTQGHSLGGIFRMQGFNTAAPENRGVAASFLSPTTPLLKSLTPTVARTLLVGIYFQSNSDIIPTTPSGWTREFYVAAYDSGSFGRSMYVYSRQWPNASTATGDSSLSGGTDGWTHTFAIAPAS